MAGTTTELSAILINSGMAADEAAKCAAACADATIGITSIVSVLGYDGSGLSAPGTPAFTATVDKLIKAVADKDATALSTNALKGQFTTAIRKCAREGADQEAQQLKAIGLGATPNAGALVLGNEGEPVFKREDCEKRRNFDAAIGGYWHVSDATPSTKMVSFFAKCLAEEPPVLRLFPLGNACSDFNAKQARKPQSLAEKLVGEREDQFDSRGDAPSSKVGFMKALTLVGNAIAIAASVAIPTADQKKYSDLESGRVSYGGSAAYIYGSRYITELLVMTAMVEGDRSDTKQLLKAYEEVMKTAGRYITNGYMVNAAFTRAVHEEKHEWRAPRRDPPLESDQRGKKAKTTATAPTTEKQRQLVSAREAARKACGDFNRATGCSRSGCKFAHHCSAVVQVNGKFEVCSATDHSRAQHLEMARNGAAPTVIS